MILFILNNQLFFILVIALIFIVLALRIYRYSSANLDLDDETNILGFGKAEGVYLVKIGNYYLVAGMKLKNKKEAVKKFIDLVEKNGYVPPKSYFKMVKVKNLK